MPGNPQIQMFLEKQRSVGISDEKSLTILQQKGVDTTGYMPEYMGSSQETEQASKPFSQKLGSVFQTIFGGTKLAQGLSTVGSDAPDQVSEFAAQDTSNASKIIQAIKKQTDPAKKQRLVEFLEKNYGQSYKGISQGDINPAFDFSNKEIIGDAAKLSMNLIPFTKGVKLNTFKAGGAFGAAEEAARAASEDAGASEIITRGAVGGLIGGTLGKVYGSIESRLALKKEAARIAETAPSSRIQGSYGPGAAHRGEIAKATKYAIKTGIDERYVNLIASSSEKDKAIMRDMFRLSEKASKDLNVTERPIERVGQSFVQRVKFLFGKRQEVGKNLGSVVKKVGEKQINTRPVLGSFMDDLAEANVGITRIGKNKFKLNFSSSVFANDAASQRMIKQTFKDIAKTKTFTQGHILRQRLFNDLDLASQGTGLSTNTERILGKVRSSIGEIMETSSAEYKAFSSEYAKLSDLLTRFNKIMGGDFKLQSATANLRAGEVMRRVLSNSSARPLQIVLDADDLVKFYGQKKTANLRTLINFADLMEDVFGIQQRTSLGGQVQRAGERLVDEGLGVAEDVAQGRAGKLIMRAVGTGLKKIMAKTPEKQQKAIRLLIGL